MGATLEEVIKTQEGVHAAEGGLMDKTPNECQVTDQSLCGTWVL